MVDIGCSWLITYGLQPNPAVSHILRAPITQPSDWLFTGPLKAVCAHGLMGSQDSNLLPSFIMFLDALYYNQLSFCKSKKVIIQVLSEYVLNVDIFFEKWGTNLLKET